jgi:hypothetical protein
MSRAGCVWWLHLGEKEAVALCFDDCISQNQWRSLLIVFMVYCKLSVIEVMARAAVLSFASGVGYLFLKNENICGGVRSR